MASTLSEVVANVSAERRAKIAAAREHKLIAEEQRHIAVHIAVEKWLRIEEAKRVMELDRNLITIAAIITAFPIIATLAWILTALAMGGH